MISNTHFLQRHLHRLVHGHPATFGSTFFYTIAFTFCKLTTCFRCHWEGGPKKSPCKELSPTPLEMVLAAGADRWCSKCWPDRHPGFSAAVRHSAQLPILSYMTTVKSSSNLKLLLVMSMVTNGFSAMYLSASVTA